MQEIRLDSNLCEGFAVHRAELRACRLEIRPEDRDPFGLRIDHEAEQQVFCADASVAPAPSLFFGCLQDESGVFVEAMHRPALTFRTSCELLVERRQGRRRSLPRTSLLTSRLRLGRPQPGPPTGATRPPRGVRPQDRPTQDPSRAVPYP